MKMSSEALAGQVSLKLNVVGVVAPPSFRSVQVSTQRREM